MVKLPHLSPYAIVEPSGVDLPVHKGTLDFYSGGVHAMPDQISKLSLIKEASDKATDKHFDGWYLVRFETKGGVSYSLILPTDTQFDDETQAMFQLLRGYTHAMVNKRAQVNLRIRVKAHSNDENEDLWKALNNLKEVKTWPWASYMRVSGLPKCQFDAMLTRRTVADRAPPIRYPAKNSFADVREGEIKLCYAAWIEHDWATAALKQLAGEGPYSVQFFHIVEKAVMTQVRLAQRHTTQGHLIKVKPGTVLARTWNAAGHDKPYTAKTVAMKEWMGLNSIDLLLPMFRKPELFTKRRPYMAAAYGATEPSLRYSVAVTPMKNEADVKRQISAVHELCGTRNEQYKKWWPLLLNQEIFRFKDKNWFESARSARILWKRPRQRLRACGSGIQDKQPDLPNQSCRDSRKPGYTGFNATYDANQGNYLFSLKAVLMAQHAPRNRLDSSDRKRRRADSEAEDEVMLSSQGKRLRLTVEPLYSKAFVTVVKWWWATKSLQPLFGR